MYVIHLSEHVLPVFINKTRISVFELFFKQITRHLYKDSYVHESVMALLLLSTKHNYCFAVGLTNNLFVCSEVNMATW